jgi:hypothetical protein
MKAEQKDQLIARLSGLIKLTNESIHRIRDNEVHLYEDIRKEINRLESRIKHIKDYTLPKIKTHEKANFPSTPTGSAAGARRSTKTIHG